MNLMAIILMSFCFLPMVEASEPMAENDNLQISTRYVKWSHANSDKPVPKNFYDIPRYLETDGIAIELNDVFPDRNEQIPDHEPAAQKAAQPASFPLHQ